MSRVRVGMLVCVASLGLVSAVLADESAVGNWDLKYKIRDRDATGKLAITLSGEGVLAGKWTSERGESKISAVKFEKSPLPNV